MQFVRKALVFLATVFLPFWLFAIALSASIILTLHNPSKIKRWISESGVYTKAVDAVVAQSQKTAKHDNDEIPLSDPHVKDAAKRAFSPQILQRNTDNVIDGMYGWLQGKTAQPDFRIDLAGPKQQFATNIGNYLRDRTKHLPPCTNIQLANQTNIFTITCLPPGYNVNAEIQDQVNKLAHSKDFLGDSVITAKDVKDKDNQPVFTGEKLSRVPLAYKRARWSPWWVGLLALGGMAVIVFLNDNRRKGIKRVAWILVGVGGLIVLGSSGLHQSLNQLDTQIKLQGANAQLQPALVSFIRALAGSLSNVYLWFGLIYLALGVAAFSTLKFWLHPAPEKATEPTPTTDKKSETTKAKQ
jgi:hypothetical protein